MVGNNTVLFFYDLVFSLFFPNIDIY